MEKKRLLEILEEFNCGKCRYLGRAWNQCKCFWGGTDNPRTLFPDVQMPMVCRKFEVLRKGEKLGEMHTRLSRNSAISL